MSDQTSGNARQEPRIRVSNNGPYQVSGGAQLTTRTPVLDQHGDAVAWTEGPVHKSSATYVLCRCGQSRNKPFCDGSHQKVGFDGTCTADRAPSAARRKVYAGVGIVMTPSGRLQYAKSANEPPVEIFYPPTVATIPNGALWVLGGVPVETADGFTYEVRNRQLLCRCGASENKPFCDGSHRRVKFQAP